MVFQHCQMTLKTLILRGSWSDRVTEVVISGPIGVTQLGLIADEFALRLFNAGVTKTRSGHCCATSCD